MVHKFTNLKSKFWNKFELLNSRDPKLNQLIFFVLLIFIRLQSQLQISKHIVSEMNVELISDILRNFFGVYLILFGQYNIFNTIPMRSHAFFFDPSNRKSKPL